MFLGDVSNVAVRIVATWQQTKFAITEKQLRGCCFWEESGCRSHEQTHVGESS